jgi:hypothetical protein
MTSNILIRMNILPDKSQGQIPYFLAVFCSFRA